MNALSYRLEKHREWIDGQNYPSLEQACWVWSEIPEATVVEVNIEGSAERRLSTEECREQLKKSPAPRI